MDENQGLAEENAALKKNCQTLAEAHGKELAQNEELKAELLALARAQDDLRRQVEEQQQSAMTSSRNLHSELDRVRDLISRLSQDRVKVGRNGSHTAWCHRSTRQDRRFIVLFFFRSTSWKSLVETWSMSH